MVIKNHMIHKVEALSLHTTRVRNIFHKYVGDNIKGVISEEEREVKDYILFVQVSLRVSKQVGNSLIN
jgi:hypothetical protein